MITSVATFLSISILVIVTPGPDTAVTISGTLGGGRRGGVFTALGVATGQTIWTLLTSVGLAALLVASEPAFLVLKYAGVAYLLYLGLQSIRSALSRTAAVRAKDASRSQPTRASAYVRRGLLSDLGSPKMAVFFTSLLPQFGSNFLELMLLGLVFAVMTFVWLAFYATAVSGMGGLLRRPRVRRALDAVTGVVLVGLGIRVAVEPR